MVGNNQVRVCEVTYKDIASLTDVTLNAVYQAATPAKNGKSRQLLDLESLESVVLWLAAHGKTDLRRRICAYSAQALLDEGALSGAPKKRRRSSSSVS